jgi:ADP-ribose pyrophosphatase YjhB (NUDIX family)
MADPTSDSDTGPDFDDLAGRDGVERRATVHDVDAEAFADARHSIEGGLTWAVGAVVADDRGRVLLVREDGRWLAPGGEVEPGESHHEALVREVREETGVEITVQRPVAATNVTFHRTDTGARTGFYFAHYVATPETSALTDDPGLADEDIERAVWAESVPENTVDRDVIVANSPAEPL